MKRFTQQGFTIVELIIVIVVIAILITITIVAYNGVQDRAKQTVTLNAFDQYEQLIKSYKGTNGYYPPTQTAALDGSTTVTSGVANSLGFVCLGVNGPAQAPFSATQCYNGVFFGATMPTTENPTIDAALQTMSSTLQNSVGKTVTSSDGTANGRGVMYYSQRKADGTSGATYLVSVAASTTSCGRATYYAANTPIGGTSLSAPIPICFIQL